MFLSNQLHYCCLQSGGLPAYKKRHYIIINIQTKQVGLLLTGGWNSGSSSSSSSSSPPRARRPYTNQTTRDIEPHCACPQNHKHRPSHTHQDRHTPSFTLAKTLHVGGHDLGGQHRHRLRRPRRRLRHRSLRRRRPTRHRPDP